MTIPIWLFVLLCVAALPTVLFMLFGILLCVAAMIDRAGAIIAERQRYR